MAAKPDAKEKEAAGAAPDKAAPAEGAAPAPKQGGALKTWLPVILAVIAAPAASFAVAQFVLLPKLQAKLAAPAEAGAAEAHGAPAEKAHAKKEKKEEKKKEGHGGKEEGGGGGGDTYEFTNVVVNLSGTMGTRYLKTSFVVTGAEPDTIKEAFEENKARLQDVTLGVLSSLSLADLEEPGAKNVLREKLVSAYNQALGHRIAEQVYFSDFVVQ
jgi:flagellar FliL protein